MHLISAMIPRREALIASLIQYKLSLRRFYRNWHRTSTSKALPFLRTSSSSTAAPRNLRFDDDDDVSNCDENGFSLPRGQFKRPAQLPASKPDRDVLPLPLLLTVLYVLALSVRLWSIGYPPAVVFDEVHFLRFVRAYYRGEYFFDIHPPLGKLVLLIVTHLFCGEPTHEFARNGEKFNHNKYIPLRVTGAIFGAAVSPLTYGIARELGMSSWASLFAAVVQVIEHLAVVESRLVLLDGQLMAWMALSLLLALRLWSRPCGRRWGLVVGTALAGSAAISVKWTALATPALIALVSLSGWPFPKQQLLVEEMGIAGIVALALYTILFWVHFKLLPKSGRGDAFMDINFQATLIGNKLYEEEEKAFGPGFLNNFVYLNAEMYVANKGIKARHRWESKWWQWIINQRGLLFHNDSPPVGDRVSGEEGSEKIYLIVNPAVTFITCVAILVFIVLASVWVVRKWRRRIPVKSNKDRRRMHAFVVRGAFLLAGYILNLLPYIGMSALFISL